jgi:hypothetical protein
MGAQIAVLALRKRFWAVEASRSRCARLLRRLRSCIRRRHLALQNL